MRIKKYVKDHIQVSILITASFNVISKLAGSLFPLLEGGTQAKLFSCNLLYSLIFIRQDGFCKLTNFERDEETYKFKAKIILHNETIVMGNK
jgi:hypothetical protein